ncbi:MAG: cold shock domain protein CspD [Oleibacter sp.]|nr:cold shock domain protein CspD [Thalassolituus sp.]|tara:strand:- start:303 stop:584 length:282 start_codon:yes stop_codon:yes gene_type:complete
MKTGKVKWFNNAKGYGFILADDSNEDLFAHYSMIEMDGYRTLKAGQTVIFDTKPSDKGTHAINIRTLDSETGEESKAADAADAPAASEKTENA